MTQAVGSKGFSWAVATTVALSAMIAGCSRDHIKAVELMNEAQGSIKSNPRAAIEKLEEARNLAPQDHLILDTLGAAYRKDKKWDKAASIMGEAAAQAPTFASYSFWQGYSLIQKAEAANFHKETFEEAKKPLEACIKKDPNYAECYYWLGYAQYQTRNDQEAAKQFTSAIEHNPTEGYYYFELTELYVTYKLYKEAGAVIDQAEKLVKPTEKNAPKLVQLQRFKFEVARSKGDLAGAVVALESARKLAPEDIDLNYDLGSTYAVIKPPRKEEAARLLKAFSTRMCKGEGRKKREVQCLQTDILMRDLEGK